MRIVVEARDLPGAGVVSDGVPLHDVHVALQIGNRPVGLVRGDAETARWEIDVDTVTTDGVVDLRGPAVHGKKGERFLYLTRGDLGADGSFVMFRRAKLMIGDIEPELLTAPGIDRGDSICALERTTDDVEPRVKVAERRLVDRMAGNVGTCVVHDDQPLEVRPAARPARCSGAHRASRSAPYGRRDEFCQRLPSISDDDPVSFEGPRPAMSPAARNEQKSS